MGMVRGIKKFGSHLDPADNPVHLVRRELVVLDEGRRQPFDRREDLPDDVVGDDLLHAVEDRLLADLRGLDDLL